MFGGSATFGVVIGLSFVSFTLGAPWVSAGGAVRCSLAVGSPTERCRILDVACIANWRSGDLCRNGTVVGSEGECSNLRMSAAACIK